MEQQLYAYCTIKEFPPMEFPHELHAHHDRTDPGFADNLQQTIGYAMRLSNGK